MKQTLDSFLESIPKACILCVGDVMLDYFIYGNVERISPEAPVPVFHKTQQTCVLGGAGNVVRNLSSLSVQTTFLSVVGPDAEGKIIENLLGDLPHVQAYLLTDPQRDSTTKTRYIAHNQQLLRADKESTHFLSQDLKNQLIHHYVQALEKADVIVLSDYGKGLFDRDLISVFIQKAQAAHKPTLIDPKGNDYSIYDGATVLTPNLKELATACGKTLKTDEEIVQAAQELLKKYHIKSMIVTRSERGLTLVEDQGSVQHIATQASEVYDVSGAGDTVLAMFSAAYAAHTPLFEAAQLANIAAGIVVGKVGTATLTLRELQEKISTESHHKNFIKVQLRGDAQEQVIKWKRAGFKIGFTNGCFDLLHPGHISLLTQSKEMCDRLIVGLNSDDSIKRLKGPSRPIQNQDARSTVLASLMCVDMVVVFDEDTPLTLIQLLRPDVLIKGADYKKENVVGGQEVINWGGEVMLASLVPDQSTTRTIQQMK